MAAIIRRVNIAPAVAAFHLAVDVGAEGRSRQLALLSELAQSDCGSVLKDTGMLLFPLLLNMSRTDICP